VALDQLQELPDLIGLDLSPDFLQVHQFRDIRMYKDVVAAFGARKTETEGFNKPHHVLESDVLRPRQDLL